MFPTYDIVRNTRSAYENMPDLRKHRDRNKIFSLAYGLLHSREDARDALQDIFLKFFTSIGSFKGQSRLSTWVYRIAINTCLDRLKKIARQRTESLEGISLDLTAAGSQANPRESAIGTELAESLRRAIEKLPLDQRSVFLLREVEGLSYREIADILHCRVGTVMSRLHYARKSLRKDLGPFLK